MLDISQVNPKDTMTQIYDQMTEVFHNIHEKFRNTPIQDLSEEVNKSDNSYFSSDEYLALSAEEKMAKLWEKMEANDQGKFPVIAGLMAENMNPTFDTKGDALPNTKHGVRPKYIHSVGVVGKVKFIPEPDTPYTGVFKGADYGIIRLSTAAKPGKHQPLTPGLGFKVLRDGVDSANLVAMFGLNGQPGDWNFFSNDFWNHISAPTGVLHFLAKKFTEATEYIQEVSLKNFATNDAAGNVETEVIYPYSIGFKPHDDVKNLFPKDLPDKKDYMAYMKQLPTVPENSVLYNIYALDKPRAMEGEEKLIGRVQLDGSLKSSKWADENLFIRHERVDDDVADHSDWGPFEPRYDDSKKAQWGCPFGFTQ